MRRPARPEDHLFCSPKTRALFYVPPVAAADDAADQGAADPAQLKQQLRDQGGYGRKSWAPDPALGESDQAEQIRRFRSGADPEDLGGEAERARAAAAAERAAEELLAEACGGYSAIDGAGGACVVPRVETAVVDPLAWSYSVL